jgi:hypothetical protein
MINDREFLYGAAFSRLVDCGIRVTIDRLSNIHPSVYIIEAENSKSAVLFKTSKKPKSSWSFTITHQEQLAIDSLALQDSHVKIFVSLICHKDGICCISKDILWDILNLQDSTSTQYISVSRKERCSYHISTSGRKQMERSIPQNNWPYIILKT